MPVPTGLNTTGLQAALKQAQVNRMSAKGLTPSADQLAEMGALASDQANAIDTYVRNAIINYTSGLVTGTGPVTGIFTGNLQ